MIKTLSKFIGCNLWLICCYMLTCPSIQAQRNDTIYQNFATNSTSTSLTVVSGPVRNIGQSSHQAILQLTNKTAQTCDTTKVGFTLNFLGNYTNDVTTSVQLPSTSIENSTNTSSNGIGYIIQANNAYPYVWIKLVFTASDFTHCIYSLNYTGTIAPGVIQSANNYNTINFTSSQAVLAMGANGLVAAIAGDQRFSKFYIIVAGATTATDITFSCNAGGTSLVISVPAEGTVTLPYSNIPYLNCAATGIITATASTATATIHWWSLIVHNPVN